MIAHELKQTASATINFSAGLRMYLKQKGLLDETVKEVTGRIEVQAARIAAIVDRVHGYAKKDDSTAEVFVFTTPFEQRRKGSREPRSPRAFP